MEKNEVRAMIERVRAGDQEAFSSLLTQYRPLIEALVSRFLTQGNPELHRDDLRQEATLVFYNSILTYDSEQSEVEFGLYAKICIYHGLISQMRLHKKHPTEQLTESLSEAMSVHDSSDPAAGVLEREREKALYSVIRQNLSDFEYRVWQYYMSGQTAREIGRLVGRDERSVNNAIYRIRRKLREALSNHAEHQTE